MRQKVYSEDYLTDDLKTINMWETEARAVADLLARACH